MYRNQILMIMLVMFIMMSVVPVTHAQDALDVSDILAALAPRTDNQTDLMWDIFLYGIFFLCLINMAFISDKQQSVSVMNFAVMAMALFSKLLVGDPAENPAARLGPTDFGTFILNVGIMILPFMIAGMVRKDKGQKSNHAVIPAILTGFLGGGYFFLYWFQEMGGASGMSSL